MNAPIAVLAWDPGSEKSAYARLRWDGGPRAEFEDGAVIPFGVPHLDESGVLSSIAPFEAQAVLAASSGRCGHVAVEFAQGYAFEKYRVPGLLGARGAGDALMLLSLFFADKHAWAISAPTWRADLVRSKSPTDAQIAIAVRGLVDGLPALPKAKGAHVIDACGLAIYVLRKLGAKLTLPAEVETELYRQTRADKSKAKAKRAKTIRRGVTLPGELFARGGR